MKKYFIFAASALALASCSSDDYLGNNPGNENGASSAINFGGGTGKTTRAGATITGGQAADLLGKQFVVAGFKGDQSTDGITSTTVFDNYFVKWDANTAGTADDNTSDWHYVGLIPNNEISNAQGTQTIKYWDYSAGQYDFIAYSTGKAELKAGDEDAGDNGVKVTSIKSDKDAVYTMQGSKENLAKCYIADLITVNKSNYNNVVNFTFRNLSSKVRVALYETVPGYSVKNVKFYTDATTTTEANGATLFTSDLDKKFYDKGTATVSFPTVGTSNKDNSDLNKAHVAIAGEGTGATTCAFGNLNYSTEKPEGSTLVAGYLGQSSKNASYAGSEESHYYTTVLPNENGATLTLRVDYTLYADDNSNEEITVHGATAIIPAIYAQWKSNYAYTYIFKISDKTNGKTGTEEHDPEGLFPITFDAVVADAEDGSQSTITTVADHSITTYQKGHDVTKDEYASGNDIYVMVHNGTGLDVLTGKAALYTVTKDNNNGTVITEATVHDALTIDSKTEGNETTTGRNGLTLTKATLDETITTIPGVDGNNISVTQGTAAKFSTTTPGTYAFVYDITPENAPAGEPLVSAITFTETTDLTNGNYYTDKECREDQKATGNSETGKIYYQKITNNGKTFAIKVIKVVE